MLRVIDIIELVSEYTFVELSDGVDVLSFYDGKNNLDEIYNSWIVDRMTVKENKLIIYIFEE